MNTGIMDNSTVSSSVVSDSRFSSEKYATFFLPNADCNGLDRGRDVRTRGSVDVDHYCFSHRYDCRAYTVAYIVCSCYFL